jgi:hypothetical protein
MSMFFIESLMTVWMLLPLALFLWVVFSYKTMARPAVGACELLLLVLLGVIVYYRVPGILSVVTWTAAFTWVLSFIGIGIVVAFVDHLLFCIRVKEHLLAAIDESSHWSIRACNYSGYASRIENTIDNMTEEARALQAAAFKEKASVLARLHNNIFTIFEDDVSASIKNPLHDALAAAVESADKLELTYERLCEIYDNAIAECFPPKLRYLRSRLVSTVAIWPFTVLHYITYRAVDTIVALSRGFIDRCAAAVFGKI